MISLLHESESLVERHRVQIDFFLAALRRFLFYIRQFMNSPVRSNFKFNVHLWVTDNFRRFYRFINWRIRFLIGRMRRVYFRRIFVWNWIWRNCSFFWRTFGNFFFLLFWRFFFLKNLFGFIFTKIFRILATPKNPKKFPNMDFRREASFRAFRFPSLSHF